MAKLNYIFYLRKGFEIIFCLRDQKFIKKVGKKSLRNYFLDDFNSKKKKLLRVCFEAFIKGREDNQS